MTYVSLGFMTYATIRLTYDSTYGATYVKQASWRMPVRREGESTLTFAGNLESRNRRRLVSNVEVVLEEGPKDRWLVRADARYNTIDTRNSDDDT